MKRNLLSLWPYVLINVIVSALTTIIILSVWYAREHKSPAYALLKTPVSDEAVFSSALDKFQPTLPSLEADTLQIKNIYGNGDLQTEFIQIEMIGSGDLWLTGWQIVDANKHSYTFPRLQLHSGGTINLYTKVGFDSVTDLYWGSTEPLWSSGNSITILDSENQIRVEYPIP
jgi:hypothetical protein